MSNRVKVKKTHEYTEYANSLTNKGSLINDVTQRGGGGQGIY